MIVLDCKFIYLRTHTNFLKTVHFLQGILQYAIKDAFSLSIQHRKEKIYCFRLSIFEIYQESISDLLEPGKMDMRIAEDDRVCLFTYF